MKRFDIYKNEYAITTKSFLKNGTSIEKGAIKKFVESGKVNDRDGKKVKLKIGKTILEKLDKPLGVMWKINEEEFSVAEIKILYSLLNVDEVLQLSEGRVGEFKNNFVLINDTVHFFLDFKESRQYGNFKISDILENSIDGELIASGKYETPKTIGQSELGLKCDLFAENEGNGKMVWLQNDTIGIDIEYSDYVLFLEILKKHLEQYYLNFAKYSRK